LTTRSSVSFFGSSITSVVNSEPAFARPMVTALAFAKAIRSAWLGSS
jgi:hypothetical protein